MSNARLEAFINFKLKWAKATLHKCLKMWVSSQRFSKYVLIQPNFFPLRSWRFCIVTLTSVLQEKKKKMQNFFYRNSSIFRFSLNFLVDITQAPWPPSTDHFVNPMAHNNQEPTIRERSSNNSKTPTPMRTTIMWFSRKFWRHTSAVSLRMSFSERFLMSLARTMDTGHWNVYEQWNKQDFVNLFLYGNG